MSEIAPYAKEPHPIENGIHYSIMDQVWKAVDDAANTFDVQIFATTHSFECLQAAHAALGNSAALRFHRLEATEPDGHRCVTFEPEEIEAAIRHGLEVR